MHSTKKFVLEQIKVFKHKAPYTYILFLSLEDSETLFNSYPINLEGYKDNIIYITKGHHLSQDDQYNIKQIVEKYFLNENITISYKFNDHEHHDWQDM